MKDSAIAERGSHQQLLERGGAYTELVSHDKSRGNALTQVRPSCQRFFFYMSYYFAIVLVFESSSASSLLFSYARYPVWDT